MRKGWKQWIGGGVATLLVIAAALVLYAEKTGGLPGVVFGVTPTDSKTTQSTVATDSKPSKDSTKPLGSAENPFVVLEIVSDESYSELGYLISECEPVDLERLSYYAEMANIINAKVGITGDKKDNYYFADEKEYKTATEESTKNVGLNFIGTPSEASGQTEVYGYYEMVAEGKGSFQKDSLTSDIKYVGDNQGNVSWHTLNDGTQVDGGEASLLTVGDKYYTKRAVDASNENKLYKITKYNYTNENWFLTKTLGLTTEQISDYNIVLKTITTKDLNTDYSNNTTNSWISVADVISITAKSHINGSPNIWNQLEKGGSYAVPTTAITNFNNYDLNWPVVWAIYEKVMDSDNYAALVLDSTLTDNWRFNYGGRTARIQYYQLDYDGNRSGATISDNGCSNNVYKLSIMLRCMNPQLFYNLYVKADTTKNGKSTINASNGSYSEITSSNTYWSGAAFMPTTAEGKRAESWDWNENTCFDANLSKKNLVLGHTYVYGTFITDTISNNETTRKMFASTGLTSMNGLQALGFALTEKFSTIDSTAVKSGLKILEIEPCDTYSLKGRRFYLSVPSLDGDVEIVTKTSSAFVGSIEDLEATYDAIYIGTNATTLSADVNGGSGPVYCHTGAMVTVDSGQTNAIKRLRGTINGDSDQVDEYYYSGNDISSNMQAALEEYAKEHPILFDSGFYTNSGKDVDTGKIDSASYMYALAKKLANSSNRYVIDSTTDWTVINNKMAQNQFTLQLDTATPVRYQDAQSAQNSPETNYINGADLTYHDLEYNFRISDSGDNKLYGVNLYIDGNVNGRYDDSEKQIVSVYESTTGKKVKNGQLSAGVWYTARCTVDDFVGVMSWSLEAYRQDKSSLKTAQTGISAIQNYVDRNKDGKVDKEDRIEIKVLQLTPDSNGVIDLTADTFTKYTKDLDIYNINTTKMKVSDFAKEVEKNSNYLDKNGYSVIVVGFSQTYNDGNSETVRTALADAIDRGIGVIFTYDTTSYVNLTSTKYADLKLSPSIWWGYGFNKNFGTSNIRNAIGMDRYGATLLYPANGVGVSQQQVKDDGKDVAYKVGGNQTSLEKENLALVSYTETFNAAVAVVDTAPEAKTPGDISAYRKPSNDACDFRSGEWRLDSNGNHYWYCKYDGKVYWGAFGNKAHWGHSWTASANADFMNQPHVTVRVYNQDTSDGKTKYGEAPTATSAGYYELWCVYCGKKVGTETIAKVKKTEVAAVQGYTNGVLHAYATGNNATELKTQAITETNSGMITGYPYAITSDVMDTVTVNATHYQYYQLDMEDEDMSVWYCLSDNKTSSKELYDYSKSPNDVRNNYYLYTKGNVTYSGMGASGTLLEDETELFVNTIIATYLATAITPKIEVTNEDKVDMNKAAALYVSYEYNAANTSDFNLLTASQEIDYQIVVNGIQYKSMTVTYNLLGEIGADGKYTPPEEEDLFSGEYYQTDSTGKRTDAYTRLTGTGSGMDITSSNPKLSNNQASVSSGIEYYFTYGKLQQMFKQSTARYVALEIEVTLEYKNKTKPKTIRKPVLLYRRALFNLD
jgi:hypothetical protein